MRGGATGAERACGGTHRGNHRARGLRGLRASDPDRGPWPVDERWVYSLALLSFVFACASLEFSALVRRLALRAATPLPAPPADPITHYREGGPLECPRHPFAR